MHSTDSLERSLQEVWDRQTLSVYADALIAEGDPRGELIALDLAIAAGNTSAELVRKRADRIAAWLDGDLYLCGLELSNVRFGLIENCVYTGALLENLHRAGVGRYLRSVSIAAAAVDLPKVLKNLVAEPLPWLQRLSIQQTGVGPLLRSAVEEFAERTPNLTELILEGDHVMVTPGHPNVTTLRIADDRSLVVGPKPMPAVAEVDLAFDSSGSRQRGDRLERLKTYTGLLNPRAFPSLRTLDLSRNEFIYPTDHPINVGVFPIISALETPDRITHFRLPSLRTPEDLVGVRELLEHDPERTIEVVRMYAGSEVFMGGFEHARLHVAPPRPWPPRDRVSGRSALTITIPNHRYGDEVSLSTWVDTLEVVFDEMEELPKRSWLALWKFLDDLPWEADDGETVVRPFPAATLLSALAVMDDHRSIPVVDKLQSLEPSQLARTAVTIERYWGW